MKAFGLKLNENAEKERSALGLQFVSGLGGSPLAQTYEAVYASVAENRELQAPESGRSTRHIEITLPKEVAYHEGDHLGVAAGKQQRAGQPCSPPVQSERE